MDFEAAVRAFQNKMRPKSEREEKRQAYLKLLKTYNSMKYGQVVDGKRVEREITQERIDRVEKNAQEEKQLRETIMPAEDILNFVDIDLGAVSPTGELDLSIGGPTTKRKASK